MGAHGDDDGMLGEVGDGPEPTNQATATGGSEEGKSVGAVLRGISGRVSRRRGQGRHCGARERVGEERGWRWPRGSSSAATAAFGRLRERKQRRGGPRGE